DSYRELPWGALDDVVMGGVSRSTFQINQMGNEHGRPTGVFQGEEMATWKEFSVEGKKWQPV
ncbi:hypothetical protein Dimus_001753, partial [Dionaea muscipula]